MFNNIDKQLYEFHVFAFLALATLLFFFMPDSYQATGPELLKNNNFSQGMSHWRHARATIEQDGVVRLHSTDFSKYTHITQKITDPDRFKTLRLSGDIKTQKVEKGKRGWQKARLILTSHDVNGKWIPAPHHVALISGSNPWRHYSEVFTIIPEEASELQISAQLPKAIGTMWVKNLSLTEVVEKSSYTYFKWFGIGLWAIFLIWLLLPYIIACNRIILQAAIFLALVAVIIGTMTTGEQRHEFEKDSFVALQKMTTEKSTQTILAEYKKHKVDQQLNRKMLDIAKAGHFVGFALLAVCLSLVLAASPVKYLLLDISMFAGATELMQYFIEGRTPLFNDWLIDISGAILGLGIVIILRRFKREKNQGHEPSPA